MKSRILVPAALIPLLLAEIGFSHSQVDKLLKQESVSIPTDVLPSPDAIKLCALGYDQLIADCYWLAFVQYVGDTVARSKDQYAAADKYLDLIIGLDPKFINAYWFAAFVVGSDAKKPEKAAEIIDRGIQANPDNWYLPFIAGINQYLFAHNVRGAAKYYRMAGKFPEAPQWLSRQADILEKQIPTIIKDIRVWDNIFRSEKDPLVKEKARAKLIALWQRVESSATTDTIRRKAQISLEELRESAP